MSCNLYDAGIALSGVACFINPDLATDLYSDILSLVSSDIRTIYSLVV